MASIDDRLREYNPWWSPGWDPGVDIHLSTSRESLFEWSPPALHALPLEPGETHIIRGPRQVGKTTILKRVIADLVRRGERHVLYYAFDLDRRPDAIVDVIRRAKELHPDPGQPWYLFLDEVTAIPDWGLGVKSAWDHGLTRGDLVVLTGSSARDLETNREYLPGRRGRHPRDIVQLPMSFRDFCRCIVGLELPDETLRLDTLLTEEGARLLKTLNLQFPALQHALDTYITVGGFPAALRDYREHGQVLPETLATIWTAIAGEVQRAGRERLSALKLLDEVNISLGNPLKWTDVARRMDVPNPGTARDYAKLLAETFTLLTVYLWDLSGGNLKPLAERKLFFMDPLLAQIPPAQIRGARGAPRDGLLENLVAIGLFRSAATQLTQAEPVPGTIAYWRSTNRREIDFVAAVDPSVIRSQRFPVEVKGDNASRISDAVKAITRSFGRGLITSRTVFDWTPDVPVVPLAVFLAALQEHPERQAV